MKKEKIKHKHKWIDDGYGRDDFDIGGYYCKCGIKKLYDTIKKKWFYVYEKRNNKR